LLIFLPVSDIESGRRYMGAKMPKFVTLFAISSLMTVSSAWGVGTVRANDKASACEAMLSGKDLFLKAIGEKNDPAALFLMTHLPQLHADKQSDAQLINEAITAGASKAVVAALLSDRRNLRLVDLRGRTPLRASLASANVEAQEVLSNMGQNPGMFDQLQTSFSELRKVLAGLKDLGLTKQERRTFVETKWESFYNGKFSDRLTFTEVLAMALKARNLDVLKFAQASGKKFNNSYSDNAFGPIALELIKAGGSENLPYLRFLNSYVQLDFFKIGFMEQHNDNHSFNRGSVFDLVYEYAVRGKVLRENTDIERMPDYVMLKFLFEEVGYKPGLWTSNNMSHLATSADSRLLDYLVNGAYPAREEFVQITKEGVESSGQRHVFDIWKASMPTESYLEGQHKGSWSYDELPLPNGIDPKVVDKEKIDILLKAGYDPSKSIWLNTAASEIADGKEQSYEYGGRNKVRVEYILNELRQRGYKFAK
jgi:hypothetical protein